MSEFHDFIAKWFRVIAFVLCAMCVGLVSGPSMAQEGEPVQAACGGQAIRIAAMQWPSSQILAHIHAEIVSEAFSCATEVVSGDLAASLSSMITTGQPGFIPELWITRVAPIWNSAIEARTVRASAPSYLGGAFEGWFAPQHLVDAYPGIVEAEQLADIAATLAAGTDDQPGQVLSLVSCPPDWACALINRNLVRALGLDDVIEVIEPANRFEMDTLIAQAMSQQSPMLFYYWQPNAVLAQFDLSAIQLPAFNEEAFTCLAQLNCAAPQVSAFPPESVSIVVASWVGEQVPELANYALRASMPLNEMNAVLKWQAENGADVQAAARHFVETRAAIWSNWIN